MSPIMSRLKPDRASDLNQSAVIAHSTRKGCMGMYNAILDDELLKPLGIHKERLSQSALFAEMRRVPDEEAAAVRAWLDAEGMTFQDGHRRGHRTDRRAAARTVQDVHRRPADQRRFRPGRGGPGA